jgi:hypothetical protein
MTSVIKIKNPHLFISMSSILSSFFRLIVYFLLLNSAYCFAQQNEDITAAGKINQIIADYPGNCPCPYNTDKSGKQCGKRSAWYRAGGHSPICYSSDVTPEMHDNYQQN